GWTEVVKALNEQGSTLSSINLGTDHLVNIDQKIGTLGKAASLSLNMRGDAVKDLHAQLMSVGVALPASETTDGILGVGTRDALPYAMNGAAANIEVRTFDAQGSEVRLSNPKVNADRGEVLNLVAPSAVTSQANEFMLLTGDLGKVVGPDLSKLALAQEDEDR